MYYKKTVLYSICVFFYFLLCVFLIGHMLLSIAVLDINDNAPVFKEAEYLAKINESAASATFVVQVRETISFYSDLVRAQPDRPVRHGRRQGATSRAGTARNSALLGLHGGDHRRRIKTEEKIKVVASVREEAFIQFLAALAILPIERFCRIG